MGEPKTVQVKHPETGDVSEIVIPSDHDGSRVKVEFPDGKTTYTEGFDPAERALRGEQFKVPCGECRSPQTLTGTGFVCSACGARNEVEAHASRDAGQAADTQV